MAAVAGGAAVGGSNPSGDGGPRLRSPPGKGSKPAALADITNTGKPNASRSISVADVVKENAKLIHLLNEKTKIIELSRVEIHKLRIALQSSRQQNLQLAQTNSQMLAELNTGKDRIKTLQHELSCKSALLNVKDSEVERKNNQWRREVNSQEVLKAIPSKVAGAKSHRVHGSGTSGVENQLVESQSVSSNFVCQEPPEDAKKRKKRKSESNECIKDTNIMQGHFKPHLQPVMSSDYEELRKPQRRRSARLNHVSCEIAEVSHKTSHEDTVDPSGPSILSVRKQHGQTMGNDMRKSLQGECSAIAHEVLMPSEEEEIEINEEPQKEANLKQISGVPFMDIIEPPKRPVTTGIRRSSNRQKLALCEAVKAAEDLNSKCDTATSSEPLCQEKIKSRMKESATLNPVSSEDTIDTFDTLHEDAIAPLASSNSNASVEQKIAQKQNDACSSMKSTEGQVVAGRRSLRRAAEKVISYKEIPLNVKMRRP